jgi:cell division protein FtsW
MENNKLEKLGNSLLVNVLLILFFGVIMVFSSSYMYARENFDSPTHFLIKQVFFILLGSGVAFILSRSKITFWYKQAYFIHSFFIFLLFLTLVPGVGLMMKGSERWINLRFMLLQPGEFVKFSLILCSIKYFENFSHYTKQQKLRYSLSLFLPLLGFILQPDFGTFAISFTIIFFIAFLSHFPRKYFYSTVVIGFISAIGILFAAPYRVKRILVFLDPWKDPKNAGFQIIQSFLAFAHGSVTGQGLGNSNEKLFYLPEAYNDFIFSVVGEELGFIGVCFGVGLFLVFTFLGFKIALSLKSRLAAMIVSAVTFSIGFQAFLNMGVVLGLLPTKGLNLPLISYGGSSMLANLAALGILFAALKLKQSDSDSSPEHKPRVKIPKTKKSIFE